MRHLLARCLAVPVPTLQRFLVRTGWKPRPVNLPFVHSCSLNCCKEHKKTCSEREEPAVADEAAPTTPSAPPRDALLEFYQSDEYLQAQLPVLLSRIQQRLASSLPGTKNAVDRELAQNRVITEVLREAVATDPRVRSLFDRFLEKQGENKR